jgi:hypothetical protein
MGWLVDAAPVASAVFAATAAGASWLSVRHGQRVWRATIEPDLHLQVMLDIGNNRSNVVVFNAGGGIAKGTAFMLVGGGLRSSGYLLDGFMGPGDKVLVTSQIPATADEDIECLVVYRTLDESSWTVTRQGEKRPLRKGATGPVATGEVVWTTVFPDRPYVVPTAEWTAERLPQS